MNSQNRLDGEPYLHYLHDERLSHWNSSQKKNYQKRQDSELGKIIYIDYLNDPFFHDWTLDEKEEFSREQFCRLKAERVDVWKDTRFSTMSNHEKYYIRANLRKNRQQCVVC